MYLNFTNPRYVDKAYKRYNNSSAASGGSSKEKTQSSATKSIDNDAANQKPSARNLFATRQGLQTALPEHGSEIYSKVKDNAVFVHIKSTAREKMEHVNLLVLVSSAPKRSDRRQAIRETWWPLCKSTDKVTVKCLFITDKQRSNSRYADVINEESQKYHDLEFQDLGGGVEFGKRYLYHMLWAVRNFEFDYFLRLDDDYFICMDKVINELPMPPLKMFHWGWVHCINGITRPEESVLLFSKDVIEKFLTQNPDTMRCHPWADQQIGLWVEDLGLQQKLPYHHDNRLHHHPPTRDLPNLLAEKDVCKGHIGLHGSYPETMRTLWQHRGTYELKDETLEQNSNICKSDLQFHWDAFGGYWKYEPKLCKTDPKWDTSKQGGGTSFGGREEGQGKK
eukprot:gene16973-18684_t